MPDARPAPTLRARIRAEMVEEIKHVARRQLAEQGAPNLSLRAVARELGFVSSAIYRYFPSRDELLTALIIDAYNSLGDEAVSAEAAVDRMDIAGRFATICHAVRGWARAHPHEYALIYGSPVPGYHAPMATIGPATRVTDLLGMILVDGARLGLLDRAGDDNLPAGVATDMARIVEGSLPGVPPAVMARGLIAWTELFGAVSFEVFGRLDGIIHDRDAWFDCQVMALTRYVGLGRAG